MASAKQQKPVNETCPQEQHRFWGSKVFGGNKQNADQQNNGWWFSSHKQGQHCSTCQCSTPDKSLKPTTPCEGMNKKEHLTIGVTITEEKITRKNDKGVLKNSAKTEMKVEEKAHGGNLGHGKNNNVCIDAKSKGKKEESACVGSNNKASVSGGVGKKKDQREQHCFRSMAGHVKQRIAMMKNSHEAKSSDSSSSDSEDERTEKKKKEKGQSHGMKITGVRRASGICNE